MTKRIPALSFLPATAVLELTYACNHQCIFCSCPWEASGGGFVRYGEQTTGQWMAIISRLCAMGVANIAFSGGEPLMRDDLLDIIKHASSCTTGHIETVDGTLVSRPGRPHLYLLSNGKAVNHATIEMCKEYGVQLSLSLPGLNTFKQHTGYDGADNVLKAFTMAKACGQNTVANITVTRLNLHELDRVIAAALLAGAEQVLLNRFLPGGRGLRFEQELSLSATEVVQMLDTAETVLKSAGRFGSLGTEVPRCMVDPSRYKSITVGTRCSAAIQFFVIGPSGYIRVCNHSPVNLNHVEDITHLKTNEYWIRFAQKKYLPAGCQDCQQKNNCDGGCREAAHIKGSSPDAPDVLMYPGTERC